MRPLVIAHVARGHRAAVQKAVSHLLLEFSYRLETGMNNEIKCETDATAAGC